MITVTQFDGYPILVYEKNGKKYMYLAGCPHKKRPITANGYKIEGDNIVCPFHKAVFSLLTGELVKQPESKTPCSEDCKLIKVEIIDGKAKFEKEPFIPELPKKSS
ncbi:Rieske 2Fe-2S domain-containing protein [Acidianus sulfidivorans JP7]|uniref:Rieske domain-containing protein n=1 Tax=Acidianus sulfidivorans JP7 TaxID=619593 RepID=A0A2U9IPT1_9CREN|nr:Rieske 2Fe-2S domain-containing protein [Acidianus sulfidivorans]AWR98059.1 Rieske 2Fe-2S domain-containing protein [Acidianus sulfidivorans JP7]